MVSTDEVARHPLPQVLANITTPLIWRAGEASPAVSALQALLAENGGGPARVTRAKPPSLRA